MINIAKPVLSDDAKSRVQDVLDSGMFADGSEVRKFEDEFAAFCGVSHGVATSNGTTALHTAFNALDIGDGDRVLTTPFSFVASANAIKLAGGEPVFADIDPETFNLDLESARSVAEETDIDAILVVHLYGLPADIEGFRELADEFEVPLIEDAAQAHGAKYNGVPVGSYGDAACFSFYPTKNITTGEGGIVLTDRDDVEEKSRSFINHGRAKSGRRNQQEVGHNFRMTSIAAVIGQEQLGRLPKFNDARRHNAELLTGGLADTSVTTPTEPDAARHVYHQYTVKASNRNELRDYLESADIKSGVYYPYCIHQQPAYQQVSHEAPIAEETSREVLSLPVHPELTEEDIETIIEEVKTYDNQF